MAGYRKEIELSDYFKLVKRIALHLKSSLPDKFQVADLIQDGMVGLVQAKNSFDRESGVPFEAFARLKIRGVIIDGVRKAGYQSRGFSKQSQAIYEATREFEDKHGREPTETELAECLGISSSKLRKFYEEANSMRFLSIDDEEIELVSDSSSNFDNEVLLRKLEPAISLLNEKEQLVLSLYFKEDMNLREISEILEISEPRVHQIKGKALVKLKGFILQ